MNAHDVFLINPPFLAQQYLKHDLNTRAPAGLLSIGSVLAEAGYHVKIIDGVIDPYYLKKIIETKNKNPLLYGITCMTAQIPKALEIAETLRQIAPEAPIVLGGVHPSLFPEQTCRSEIADIVVIGEGEYTLLELADAFKEGKSIKSIHGIAYQENGSTKITHPRVAAGSMDDLPIPRYDILDVGQYLDKNINVTGPRLLKKSMLVYAGLGCPFSCAFCVNTAFTKTLHRDKYRQKSAERVLEEVRHLVKNYQVSNIHFQDELFFAKKSRIVEVVDGLLREDYPITWTANVYANFFSDRYLSDELFEKVARSGCHRLTMGVESGCPRILKILSKNIGLDLVEKSAHLSKKYGVTMGYSFMMGIPGESRDEVVQTLRFINRLSKINRGNYIIGPQLFRPYPGSDFYELWKNNGGAEPDSFEGWRERLSASNNSSYVSCKDLGWIEPKDFDFFDILNTLGGQSVAPLKAMSLNAASLVKLGKSLAVKLRLGLDFWKYPIDAKLLRAIRRLYERFQAVAYSGNG